MKKKAFTLAEVLITLGVIGIIAESTIPTVIADMQDKIVVSSLKKAYSTLSQAYVLAVNENGKPDNWALGGWVDAQGAQNLLDNLSSNLKITKTCGLNKGQGCYATHTDLLGNSYNPDNFNTNAKAILSDGMEINMFTRSADCTYPNGTTPSLSSVCADIEVDINGHKKPNVLRKDSFRFVVTKYGIVPKGTQQDTGFPFINSCVKGNGEACTAWVIYNENMDYLKCGNDLSWGGKTKCD